MKYALLACVSAIALQTSEPGDKIMGWYMPWDSDPEGDYERAVPAHYADGTDIFMRSMVSKYALEEKMCEEDDSGDAVNCEPTGRFMVNKIGAKYAAKEVLQTHLGLKGMDKKDYLDRYFDKAWGHFDVTNSLNPGMLEVIKMPQFMRFLCNDQRMSLGE